MAAKNPIYWKTGTYDQRARNLWRNYRITLEEWNAMLAAQGGRCALCGTDNPKSKLGWATDHDHETKVVRGILCHPCNTGLGKLGGTIDGLKRAIQYLMRTKSKVRGVPIQREDYPVQVRGVRSPHAKALTTRLYRQRKIPDKRKKLLGKAEANAIHD